MFVRILRLCIGILIVAGCSKISDHKTSEIERFAISDDSSIGGGSGQSKPGVITAGEWNYLDNWSFWKNIMSREDFTSMPSRWSLYHNNRIALRLITPASDPVINALVQLKSKGTTIFTARTDNRGRADLWASLTRENDNVDFSSLTIDVENGSKIISNVIPFNEGVNEIEASATYTDEKIEVSFVVDATGSMGDELEYLKTELLDVIRRVKSVNTGATVLTIFCILPR